MSVPAGSSRSPAEEALDRLANGTWADDGFDADAATVRGRLERLTAENERLNRYIDQYILDVERLTEELDEAQRDVGIWQDSSGAYCERMVAAEAEVSRLTAELQRTREALRPFVPYDKPRLDIIGRFEVVGVRVNKSEYDRARALLAGSSVARTTGDTGPVYCVCGNVLGSENCCPEPSAGGAK